MRSRALLHRSKLESFVQFVGAHGWVQEPKVGDYEVFRAWRMDGSKKKWAIVYDRHNGDHLTTHGHALELTKRFVHGCTTKEGRL
jgi:hypothetical protein